MQFFAKKNALASLVSAGAFSLLTSLAPLQAVFAAAETGVWQEVKPGGGTVCARGEDYSFFVAPGSSDKVVIDFIGGGACWNSVNCAPESATFTDSVASLRKRYEKGLTGVYDRARGDNPLKEWTHVVVPYCTGDIHWGSNTSTYTRENGSTFTIQHKGAVNTQAVLDWVQGNIQNPKKVLVTGCSAGAYGSIYWTPAIKRIFPGSVFYQLGDSGAGVITEEFFQHNFSRWRADRAAPAWIPGLDPKKVDWARISLADLYRHIGAFYPHIQLAQFTTARDDVQTFFYELMGGEADAWAPKMIENIQAIKDGIDNFQSFVAPGYDHCVLPYEKFYKTVSAGQQFDQWFSKFINDQPVPSVMCDDCESEAAL